MTSELRFSYFCSRGSNADHLPKDLSTLPTRGDRIRKTVGSIFLSEHERTRCHRKQLKGGISYQLHARAFDVRAPHAFGLTQRFNASHAVRKSHLSRSQAVGTRLDGKAFLGKHHGRSWLKIVRRTPDRSGMRYPSRTAPH